VEWEISVIEGVEVHTSDLPGGCEVTIVAMADGTYRGVLMQLHRIWFRSESDTLEGAKDQLVLQYQGTRNEINHYAKKRGLA